MSFGPLLFSGRAGTEKAEWLGEYCLWWVLGGVGKARKA